MAKKTTSDLVKVIKDNPRCHVLVDNDNWQVVTREWLETPEAAKPYEWFDSQVLAHSEDYEGNCYGEAVLYALAEIVGITAEPV